MWISSANAAAVTKKGYRIVHAPSDYFYLVSSFAFLFNLVLKGAFRTAELEDGLKVTQLGIHILT